MKNALLLVALPLAIAFFGCDKAQDKPSQKEASSPAASPPVVSKPDPSADSTGKAGHHGPGIELGSSRIGSYDVRASRDAGEITPGGDSPVDVWVDGGVGKGVTAVRFWIGTEDAKGSVKAKADIEDGKWHTHVEVPSPLPADGKLWVEIEAEGGQKSSGSFLLKE